MSNNNYNNRLETLDSLRSLAALAVVIYHFTYRYYQIYPSNEQLTYSFSFGHYGVQAFFIISGFVIFMTLVKTKQSLDFIISRSIRLYPTYWISVIITFIIVSLFSLEGREVSILEFLLNLSMIHTQFGIKSVDGVYWTLLLELKFYFLMFILYKFNLLKKIEVISFILLILLVLFYTLNIEKTIIFKVLNQIFILQYISFFISGIIFYKIYNDESSSFSYLLLVLAFSISLFTNKFNDYIAIPCIYIIFFLLSFHKLSFINNKIFIFFGSISYALYLVHQNIGYIILNYLKNNNIAYNFSLLIAMSISILLASIITFLFEKRIIKFLKIKYKAYKDDK